MHEAVLAFRTINLVAYTALGIISLLLWRQRRDAASMWAAATFGSLGLIVVLGLVPNHPGNLAERALVRIEIAILVLFPYLLFRFTTAFGGQGGASRMRSSRSPRSSSSGRSRCPYPRVRRAATDVLHRLRRRLHAPLDVALDRVCAQALARRTRTAHRVAAPNAPPRDRLCGAHRRAAARRLHLEAVLGVVARLGRARLSQCGCLPPRLLPARGRAALVARSQTARVQEAIAGLLAFAESQEEVASRVLEPAAAIVGARAIAIRNADGLVIGAWNAPDGAWKSKASRRPDAELVEIDVPGGSLVLWTSPYAPFFGDEELALLRTLGALIGLALDRVSLFQAEHEARLALERANEVKSNFVALAAHELRTPMTTIHGFVTTLHHLSDRLDEEQRDQVRDALLQQTQRMAGLIEQLLDLSRLDAEAIDIVPEPIHVREHVRDIIEAVAADLQRSSSQSATTPLRWPTEPRSNASCRIS